METLEKWKKWKRGNVETSTKWKKWKSVEKRRRLTPPPIEWTEQYEE
jgi:hypothetical protein